MRSRPFQQPLTERFIEQDELVFAIQIASVMEHLASKNVSGVCACERERGGGGGEGGEGGRVPAC